MTVQLALDLAEYGYEVFPVNHTKDNEKKPHTSHGHKDASRDPGVIMDWWEKWPDAKPGVACGKSGILAVDVDTKNGKDGWTSLDEAWVDLGTPYSYETGTGGSHLVYSAPEGKHLSPSANYRGMVGVDIRAGESWILWAGEPVDKETLSEAPEWTLDETTERDLSRFNGELQDWFETLTPGDPNALVRRAMERAQEKFEELGNDFSHSDMVELQFEIVRLGAEGNPGAPEGLDFLEELFLSREGGHSRPEAEWNYEWVEALQSAVSKYGALADRVKNLPEYNLGLIPPSIPDSLVTQPTDKIGFSKLLGALVTEIDSDDRVASILWNCPATSTLSREWGLDFTYRRVSEARVKPEPTRENPRLETERTVAQETGQSDLSLLTDEEREFLASRPTFVDHVEDVARKQGYDQLPYFRSIGWVSAAMAFSFHGFIPMDGAHKLGLNLWFINLGDSGTGKSVSSFFRDGILKGVFAGDNEGGTQYDLGDDSSPQGLHLALLERDKQASLFAADEAAGFFSTLGLRDWKTGVDEKMTSWYNGYVQATNKLTLKEFRGKSALTSFNMHMFGTPDKVTKVVSTDMFETGFMARVNWVFGNPPRKDSTRFQLKIDATGENHEFETTPKSITDLALNLLAARAFTNGEPIPLIPDDGVMDRLSEAYERMYRLAEKREHWDIVEPSITRLAETMLKCAGICAMYRSDSVIIMDDALHAIKAVEEWYQNLFRVADMVNQGDFQRKAVEMEAWVRQRGGRATRTALFHRFRNFIERDSRELDSLLTYLLESGLLNREEDKGKVSYVVNG